MTQVPIWLKRLLRITRLSKRLFNKNMDPKRRVKVDYSTFPSYQYLTNLMIKYRVKNLVNEDASKFQKKINEFLNLVNNQSINTKTLETQRDLSIKFQWAHDHDFGEFKIKGLLGDGYIRKLATFIDLFKAIPNSLDGLKVLDIGCWTGGTSLLLNAMGADVVAIEEVGMYIDCLKYMQFAFDIKNLTPRNLTLYDCTTPEFQDSFDLVFFPGVLYHLSDPIIGLRILFNCLKDRGKILLESASLNSKNTVLRYTGPSEGWSWFIPSPVTISKMMNDVGFREIKIHNIGSRCFAVGKRKIHTDLIQSGLSRKIR